MRRAGGGFRVGWKFGILIVGFGVFLLAAGALASTAQPRVTTAYVGKGRVDGRSWEVLVDNEGPGICFEATVMAGNLRRENGRGICSYPAPQRGILLVVTNRSKRTGERTLVTAVAGAFNPAVAKVVAETFSGRRMVLPLHRLSTKKPLGVARRFRYISFGVKGTWCARKVMTYNSRGAALHTFDRSRSGRVTEPDNSPATVCPG